MGIDMDAFANSLMNVKTGGMITTIDELKENQFGIPLKHYAQQYLYAATGIRIGSFVSFQGEKGTHKSTLLYDELAQCCASESVGGLGGIAFLAELEVKLSPSILYSIFANYGEDARRALFLLRQATIEGAQEYINKAVIPAYIAACPERDKPLAIGLDSIGGSASEDTIKTLVEDGSAGKGFWNKQHYMKYFCENQGVIFEREALPVVIICVNQEREVVATGMPTFGPPRKTITGGKAQLYRDGYMFSMTKKELGTDDGNIVYIKTAKSSFSDSRKIEVEFRWNKFGVKREDAYEARFHWALASARCLAEPERGATELKSIINVTVSKERNVTCPELGLTSVSPEAFEDALMANEEILDKLYTCQKIDRLKGTEEYAAYMRDKQKEANARKKAAAAKTTTVTVKKPAAKKGKPEAKAKPKGTPLMQIPMNDEGGDGNG